jgi:Family of unknown function (DUF6507)
MATWDVNTEGAVATLKQMQGVATELEPAIKGLETGFTVAVANLDHQLSPRVATALGEVMADFGRAFTGMLSHTESVMSGTVTLLQALADGQNQMAEEAQRNMQIAQAADPKGLLRSPSAPATPPAGNKAV